MKDLQPTNQTQTDAPSTVPTGSRMSQDDQHILPPDEALRKLLQQFL